MSVDLYSAAVPILQRYLQQLRQLLAKAASAAQAQGLDEHAVLAARLVPDMFGVAQQAQIAIGFARRACAPLLDMEAELASQPQTSFGALDAYAAATLHWLAQIDATRFNAAAERSIHSEAGFAQLQLPGQQHVLHYALPNFFFHLSLCYAGLRAQGLPLSKQDFDGLHAYPAGFSFEAKPTA